MDSFGIYITPKTGFADKKALLKLHVNLWELSSKKCFIDFGIWVKEPDSIKNIVFTVPFSVKTEDFEDLIPLMADNTSLNNLIFNRDATITSSSGLGKNKNTLCTLTINTAEKPEKAVLCPTSCSQVKVHESRECSEPFTIISMDIPTRVESAEDSPGYDSVYFRFRLKSPALKTKLLSPIERKNSGFESAFTKTEIIDFKINEIRNIDMRMQSELPKESSFAKIERVDFFVMEPAENEVANMGKNAECRNLEEEWSKYLHMDVPLSHMLAYQWTKKAKTDVEGRDGTFTSYSQLVKVTYSSTNWRTLLCYSAAVILLSIIATFIYEHRLSISLVVSGISDFFVALSVLFEKIASFFVDIKA